MINQKLIDFLEEAPYARNYGIEIIASSPETECVTRWQDNFMGNPLLRAWHGGVVSSVLELTGKLAVMTSTGNKECVLLSINTSYLRPALGDKSLFSRATVVQSGKRVHTVSAIVWQNSPDKPAAMASLTFTGKRNDE